MPETKVDLSKSKLVLSGSKGQRDEWKERYQVWRSNLSKEVSDRKAKYRVKRDFFDGNQSKYTNIVNLTKREQQGHTNGVYNLAGKMIVKLYRALGNNPPHYIYKPLLKTDRVEGIKTQSVEDFVARVLWLNKFWVTSYKDACLNQSLLGNFAVMVYPDFEADLIRLINLEKMENLMVGWRGDNTSEYDFTIYEENRTLWSIEHEFGIKAPAMTVHNEGESDSSFSGHEDPYSEKQGSRSGSIRPEIHPKGKTDLPMARFADLWTDEVNAIFINGEIVQFVEHGFGFNPVKVGRNLHKPGDPWSVSDMDWLMDGQVELNEATNDVRDFLRSGVNQKYNAHNMPDFDPEALKTGSGQVIYTEDEERFDPIPVNVNTFPADLYLQRMEKLMHKLGVPEVVFGSGASAGVSGRARAIDFQSFSEDIIDKQQQWESILTDLSEAIQILGSKWFAPKKGQNFFAGPDGKPEVREIAFKWDEVLPITQSDRQVDIINKKNSRMISLRTALDEMGYDDPDAEVEKMKQEWGDKDLAPILANRSEILDGIVQAEVKAAIARNEGMQEIQTQNPPEEEPTLTNGQNETKQPMAQVGTTARFATPEGRIANVNQNREAARL